MEVAGHYIKRAQSHILRTRTELEIAHFQIEIDSDKIPEISCRLYRQRFIAIDLELGNVKGDGTGVV